MCKALHGSTHKCSSTVQSKITLDASFTFSLCRLPPTTIQRHQAHMWPVGTSINSQTNVIQWDLKNIWSFLILLVQSKAQLIIWNAWNTGNTGMGKLYASSVGSLGSPVSHGILGPLIVLVKLSWFDISEYLQMTHWAPRSYGVFFCSSGFLGSQDTQET